MIINGVTIDDTFAEAFGMRGTRVLITAQNLTWAYNAAKAMTGFATSVIACGVEAGIERQVLVNVDFQRRLTGVRGVQLLRVIRGRLEQGVIVRLDDPAAETVGQIAAIGDFDRVAMTVHEVVIAAAPQGVVERPEHGASRRRARPDIPHHL